MFASVPLLLANGLLGNGESIRVSDVEIAIHIVASRNSRSRFSARCKRMAGVDRGSAGINNTHGIEHGASILVEQNVVTHSLAYDMQADALRFEGGRIRLVIEALDCAVVHKIELDIANTPVCGQSTVRLAQIILGTGMGAVKNVKRIQLGFASNHPARVNRLTDSIVN